MKRLARWVLPALLLLAFALDLRRSGDIVRAQRLLRAVEGRTVAMLKSGNLQRPLLLAHVEALRDALRLDPADVAIRVAIGSEYLLLGDLERARLAYEEALAFEPRPEILLNLGKVALAAGDEERARAHFARAVRLDPLMRREVPEGHRDAL